MTMRNLILILVIGLAFMGCDKQDQQAVPAQPTPTAPDQPIISMTPASQVTDDMWEVDAYAWDGNKMVWVWKDNLLKLMSDHQDRHVTVICPSVQIADQSTWNGVIQKYFVFMELKQQPQAQAEATAIPR